MTALLKDRKTDRLQPEDSVLPLVMSYPVAAGEKIYAGAMVGINAAGNAIKASADTALQIMGIALAQADNTSGAAAAINVRVSPGVFYFNCGTAGDALTKADVGHIVYVIDDNTVGATSNGSTRPQAGMLFDVQGTQYGVGLGIAYPTVTVNSLSDVYFARAVSIANNANLAAFVVTVDGVVLAEGDTVLLANQTTAAENGLYRVGAVAGTAPVTRVTTFATAKVITGGSVCHVAEGTLFRGSTWKTFAAKGAVVGTDDPVFYPQTIQRRVTLVAGTITLGSTQGLYLYSTTTSTIQITRCTANTTAATANGYACAAAARTAGKSGTAAATINACIADGSLNNADISTLDVTITNW